jgi:hypothetical protein
MKLRFPLPLLFFIVVLMRAAVGQSPNGTISGLVLDPSGRAIAGAELLLVNDVTGIRYPGATNGEGIYAVPNLPQDPISSRYRKLDSKP